MVASFAVFRLVVDGRSVDLNFADAVVSLEVGAVVVCIPEAELHEGKELEVFCLVCGVLERDVIEEGIVIGGNEHGLLCSNAVLASLEDAVAHAVAAAVAVQLGLHRLP